MKLIKTTAAILISLIGHHANAAEMSTQQPTKIPAEIAAQSQTLNAEGNALIQANQPKAALTKYKAAYYLLPKPRHSWPQSATLLSNIGNAYFIQKEYRAAHQYLWHSTEAPGGTDNLFIQLRLGQASYEIGERDLAAMALEQVYKHSGKAAFNNEDPKYLRFLASKITLK